MIYYINIILLCVNGGLIVFYLISSFRPTLRTDLMVHQTNKKTQQPLKQRLLQSQQSTFEGFDQTTYFFHKFGSCFNQLQVN